MIMESYFLADCRIMVLCWIHQRGNHVLPSFYWLLRSRNPLIISFLRRYISSEKRYIWVRDPTHHPHGQKHFSARWIHISTPRLPRMAPKKYLTWFWAMFDPQQSYLADCSLWPAVRQCWDQRENNFRHFIRYRSDWPQMINRSLCATNTLINIK